MTELVGVSEEKLCRFESEFFYSMRNNTVVVIVKLCGAQGIQMQARLDGEQSEEVDCFTTWSRKCQRMEDVVLRMNEEDKVWEH